MTAFTHPPSPSPTTVADAPAVARHQGAAALGLLSFGAGFLHAAVVNAHEGHGRASLVFTVLAIFQVAWAGLVVARPSRPVLVAGAAVNAAVIAGYIVSRVSGISFIDGFKDKEPVGFTDAVTTGIEAVLVIGIVALLAAGSARRVWPTGRIGSATLASLALVVALLGVPAVSAGAEHGHGQEGTDEAAHGAGGGGGDHAAAGHGDGEAAKAGEDHGDDHETAEAKPYDPELPIDLSGTPGVSPQEQAQAENIIAVTLTRLPQWADYKHAEANGFRSIGDGGTGVEHFINRENMDDDIILDPDKPESLVYNTEGGGRRLVAAMYMVAEGTELKDVPKIGGELMQWHTHENLCFTDKGKIGGITNAEGECPPNLFKPVPTPMIHVWIEKHPCGPFAALEGIGGGTIAEGEERLCDHAHGS